MSRVALFEAESTRDAVTFVADGAEPSWPRPPFYAHPLEWT